MPSARQNDGFMRVADRIIRDSAARRRRCAETTGGRLLILLALFFASVWAGAQNALAGGGSFITLPALI
jgi:hypothetical protein